MPKPPSHTGRTLTKSRGKRAELARWLEQEQTARIGEAEFDRLRVTLAPVSDSYLRKLLRDSGVALAPMIEGVRQSSLDELESTLLALLDEYEAGDSRRRAAIRKLVVTAKDHARWALRRRRSEKEEAEKEEMILWMITWLENPPVFREWLKLRRARLMR